MVYIFSRHTYNILGRTIICPLQQEQGEAECDVEIISGYVKSSQVFVLLIDIILSLTNLIFPEVATALSMGDANITSDHSDVAKKQGTRTSPCS